MELELLGVRLGKLCLERARGMGEILRGDLEARVGHGADCSALG